MIFLVDHNLEGHALLLSGNIASFGWLDLFPIRFITFEEIELSITSNDRVVWQFAQVNQMILLTANRSMRGKNSLEQVMREENTFTSLPVVTIGDADRVLTDPDYQGRGIGKALMEGIESCLGQTQRFELFAGQKSERNTHLYARLGYAIFNGYPNLQCASAPASIQP
jgi:GNAT superfamily N-acetyltransferase